MGTSQAARAPTTVAWTRLVPSALKSPTRNSTTIADAVFSSTIPLLLPTGLVTIPLYVSSYELIRFVVDVKQNGLEKAAENSAIRISSNYIAPSIAKGLWDVVSTNIQPEIMSSPYGKLAEHAFRKTMTAIISKGTEALVEKLK